MKKFLLFLPLLAVLLASCGPTIYKAKDFDKQARGHKVVAVLPFDVTISKKRLPKNVTAEMIAQDEKQTAYNLQNHVYTYLLRRIDDYSVKFQDISKTNSMLEKAGVTYEDMRGKGKDELAKMLGVDAIVSGKTEMSKPMSDGAAVALGLLVGFWGSTNEVNASVTVHDSEADLLWKYDHTYNGGVGSSSESLARSLMKNVSKKFPYQR